MRGRRPGNNGNGTTTLSMGPAGFHNTPLTKLLLIATCGLSIFVSTTHTKGSFEFHSLSQFKELWRIFTHQLFFQSSGELLFGTLLLYQFRLFEIQLGTSKFLNMGLSSYLVYLIIHLLTLISLPNYSKFASGPYAFIFCSLVLFFMEIPPLQRFQICGIRTTDKVLTYALALQLLLSQGSRSLNAGIAGIIGGILWATQTRLFSFLKIRFPTILQQFITTSGSRPLRHPRVLSASIPAMAASIAPNEAQHGAIPQNNNLNLPPLLFPLNPGPPPLELVNELVAMGFEENAARAALIQTHNNVDLAVNLLVSN